MYDILQLNDMLVPELRDLAENIGLSGYKKLTKQDLIYKILDHQAVNADQKGKNGNGKAAAKKTASKKTKKKAKKTAKKKAARKTAVKKAKKKSS